MYIQKSETNNIILFGDLKKGDTFKTFEGYFEKMQEIGGFGFNALNLDTGDAEVFDDNTVIIKVNGSFVEV